MILAGSLLHVPQWVARAAAIYSSPMSNVIEAYRQPYQTTASPSFCSASLCSAALPAPPAGHRLVVRFISFGATCPNAAAARVSLLGTVPLGHAVSFSTMAAGGLAIAGQDVLMYFDPTDLPTIQFGVLGAGATLTGAQATVTGYIENCAAYPTGTCPVIQQQ